MAFEFITEALAAGGYSLAFGAFLGIILVWELFWRGWGMWKSANHRKIIWFIAFLIINSAGILPLGYTLFFSKIKNKKSFNKLHDKTVLSALSALILALLLFRLSPSIAAILGVIGIALLSLFSVSLIQESFDRKESVLKKILILILSPLGPLLYYFIKVRKSKKKF